MRIIHKKEPMEATIEIPGSKSLTHRALILAALSQGETRLHNPLLCDDTRLTLLALESLGCKALCTNKTWILAGGLLQHTSFPSIRVSLGNSGTSLRLLLGVFSLLDVQVFIDGSQRLRQRPIAPLAKALEKMGARFSWGGREGFLPLTVIGGDLRGKELIFSAQESSQYLSSLLLIAPLVKGGIEIVMEKIPFSFPYVEMTLKMMRLFGAQVWREANRIIVPEGSYALRDFHIEPDISNASYFWAMAAVTGGKIGVKAVDPQNSLQGDKKVLGILQEMGCKVYQRDETLWVEGQALKGVETDMGDTPDMVPTVAAVAAFSSGKTVLKNIPHLRIKESDRLLAIEQEWKKLGIDVNTSHDELTVRPGNKYSKAIVHSHNDHRIAMSLAVLGSRIGDVMIEDPHSVNKSFPGFWDIWDSL